MAKARMHAVLRPLCAIRASASRIAESAVLGGRVRLFPFSRHGVCW